MVAAKTGVCRSCFVVVVWPHGAVEGNTNLKGVVSARLARVYVVIDAAVGACVEMAAGAGLDIVAAGLHVPEQGFSQLNRRCFIGNDSFHAEYWGNGNA